MFGEMIYFKEKQALIVVLIGILAGKFIGLFSKMALNIFDARGEDR
ncbi:hypothetical protein [Liquorilactobacillus sicerae]|nr:hypothetical protein [Liquorilactobacillus sicerae]